ncbi:hypothetical protein B0H34DRAFT_861995 [Crassisporium funariophilum]|nr:hypothetical protein B0H34DRAFT_861995 [Crassisporium funariophilum]
MKTNAEWGMEKRMGNIRLMSSEPALRGLMTLFSLAKEAFPGNPKFKHMASWHGANSQPPCPSSSPICKLHISTSLFLGASEKEQPTAPAPVHLHAAAAHTPESSVPTAEPLDSTQRNARSSSPVVVAPSPSQQQPTLPASSPPPTSSPPHTHPAPALKIALYRLTTTRASKPPSPPPPPLPLPPTFESACACCTCGAMRVGGSSHRPPCLSVATLGSWPALALPSVVVLGLGVAAVPSAETVAGTLGGPIGDGLGVTSNLSSPRYN